MWKGERIYRQVKACVYHNGGFLHTVTDQLGISRMQLKRACIYASDGMLPRYKTTRRASLYIQVMLGMSLEELQALDASHAEHGSGHEAPQADGLTPDRTAV